MGSRRYTTTFERAMDRHVISDARTGYDMMISVPDRAPNLVNRVCFASRIGRSADPVPITNRDVAQYRTELPGIPVDPKLRYTEIAAGLGGLVEYIVRHPDHTGKRPLIIDPVNYGALCGLMDHALDLSSALGLPVDTQSRILDLRVRADVILDATRVRLLNMTLQEAYERHPGLVRERSDVVVELHGPSLYPDVQGEDRLDILGAAERNRRKYVELLKRDRRGEPTGKICMIVPSKGADISSFGTRA